MNERIILYNPAIGSMNEGDHIIFESASKEIEELFPDSKYVVFPTQMPVSRRVLKWYTKIDLRFICGTNLIRNQMLYEWGRFRPHFHGVRQWDITLRDSNLYGPAVMLGCGWQKYQKGKDWFSEQLWNKLLDDRYMHSVRDDYALEKLSEIGIRNAINTGCPTLWRLTPDFCGSIPKEKAQNVVTTITDYRPDERADQYMLDVLCENYNIVYVWLQGYGDKEYLKKLSLKNNIIVINGGLGSYDNLLERDDIEFVGTRLHGGIRALQHRKRATFIAVDNRTIEMGSNRGLNYLERKNINDLSDLINSKHNYHITIPEKEIERFKKQFRK